MSFSGGVYTLPGPALVTGEVVSATENNQFRNDVAGAFNVTMLRNGTSTATANLPMGGYKLTGLGAATTSGDALSYGNAAVVTTLTSTSLTATRVPYAGTGGLLQDASAFTFDGTTLTAGGFSTSGNISAATASISGNVTYSGGTANGVAYLNGSKVLTTGSALTFDGSTFGVTAISAVRSDTTPTLNFTDVAGSTKAQFVYRNSTTGNFEITNTTNASLVFGTNNAEQMRLTSTGLGIGTSSWSTSKLYVLGNTTNYAITSEAPDGYGCLNLKQTGGNTMSLGMASNGLFIYDGNAAAVRMTIDSSGNLGLGVTPSAWYSGNNSRALEFNNGAIYSFANTPEFDLGMNFYLNSGGSWIYKANGVSTRYSQQSGQHQWLIAPSGTAGNAISFTQAMTLDASGNLGVGTSSPNAKITVKRSGAGLLINGDDGNVITYIADTTGDILSYGTYSSHPVAFRTNNTERMRIDSSGNVGIGTSSPGTPLEIYRDTSSAGISAYPNIKLNNNNSVGYTGLYFYNGASLKAGFEVKNDVGALTTYVGNTERMRIDSSGNVLVGKTTNADSTVGASIMPSGRIAGTMAASTNAQDTLTVFSTGASAYRFYLDMAGTIHATNTTISAISDQRYKENIRDLDIGLDAVMALKPRKFDWKEGKGKDIKNDRGFIAQEFEQVFPDLIDEWKDPAPEGEEPYKSVRQDLIPVLVKAIQEQQALIIDLQDRLTKAGL